MLQDLDRQRRETRRQAQSAADPGRANTVRSDAVTGAVEPDDDAAEKLREATADE